MAQSPPTTLMWFRRDLRLSDNPAWNTALAASGRVCALFVLDPRLVATASDSRLALLHAHLAELDASLSRLGGALRVEIGDSASLVAQVADNIGAHRILANGDTTPFAVARDAAVRVKVARPFDLSWGTFVHAPGTVLAGTGRVSRVFTPFYRAWDARPLPDEVEAPASPRAEILGDVGVGISAAFPHVGPAPEPAGEAGARQRLDSFAARADAYLEERDVPSLDSTSSLSTDLHFGTISPRRVISEIGSASPGRAGFIRQLAWRDWYGHLLAEMPHLVDRPMKLDVGEIAWRNDTEDFAAWTSGCTGFPMVDAGMRQLARTGRMHNRVRMITASFLVKDLLVDWRLGERWFRRHLLDADVGQNVGNWQWAAGTGPDSAPFFRVFNPVLQSRKFDAAGDYIRRWVPELAALSPSDIHWPADVGPLELAAAGVVLGDNYPAPIVDHAWARDRALAAYSDAQRGAAMN